MYGAIITVFFMLAVLYLAYRRLPLLIFTLTFTVLLAAYSCSASRPDIWQGMLWLLLALLWLLNLRPLRIALISRPFMRAYRRLLPSMSDTEREALEAGTVWWDGELFTGNPDWRSCAATRRRACRPRSRPFLDGPCEKLCRMLDDFDITHRRGDLPPEVWEFLKSQRLLRDDHPASATAAWSSPPTRIPACW